MRSKSCIAWLFSATYRIASFRRRCPPERSTRYVTFRLKASAIMASTAVQYLGQYSWRRTRRQSAESQSTRADFHRVEGDASELAVDAHQALRLCVQHGQLQPILPMEARRGAPAPPDAFIAPDLPLRLL